MHATTGTESRRILIVDDDPDWREYVRICLQCFGYDTFEAATGEEALELISRERPEIVLLDLHMPGMDGEAVLENMPSHGPRVVLVTAAANDVVCRALGHGGQYYLPKGSTPEALSLLLESLIH